MLETRDVDLETVVLVDEANLGEDIPVHDAVTETGEVSSGKAVLIGSTRQINHMIRCFQKSFDDRQTTGHMPEAVGRYVK